MVADASGTVVSELRYSAFGEIRYQFGTSPTDYLYTGQRQEAEVGLYYYVARWYDPAIGRFVQADSVVPNLGSALGYDRFAYVANNPLKYIDPSGHSQICLDGEQCVDTEPGSYAHISSTQSQYNATWHPITGNLPSPTKMNPIENMYRSGYWYGRQHGGTCSTLPGDVPNQCYHPGEDVAGGYTVVAPSDGFIYFSQMDQDNNDVLDGFGNYVILQVPRGTDSYVYHILAHLENHNEHNIEQGSWITAGTPIGTMGDSGNSDGDHVHWEIRADYSGNYSISDTSNPKLVLEVKHPQSERLRSNDYYYPRNLDILNRYWIDPDSWANSEWKNTSE